YALKTAGDIHLMVDGFRDPIRAHAYYGLLARAGDQSGFVQQLLADARLSPEDRLRSAALQASLWELLADVHGNHPPRPGYHAFIDAGLMSLAREPWQATPAAPPH